MAQHDPLVTTAWLAANIAAPDLRVVDASWHMASLGRDAKAEFRECHIPGAVFFDIDDISDQHTDLPHMLPSPTVFSAKVRKLGLGDGSRIVVYDTLGIYSAPRVWWMFRVMGHKDVFVLDGGLPKWLSEGRDTHDLPLVPTPRHFTPRKHTMYVRDADQMTANLDTRAEQVLDARSEARFIGAEPEPRPGVRSGHIPGSINIHYKDVLNPDGTMKAAEELRTLFAERGVDLTQPVVTTCGSGVTAAILALALERIGHDAVAIYDGSWAEWGAREDLPAEV